MPVDLPSGLRPLLAATGLTWPDADEDALHEGAGCWRKLAATLAAHAPEVERVVRSAGDGADPIRAPATARVTGPLAECARAAETIGYALDTLAAAVLDLKATTTAQLGLLAAGVSAPGWGAADRAAATAATGAAVRDAKRRVEALVDGELRAILAAAGARLDRARAAAQG
ncbi:MAG: hypothetical protein HY241_07115 [Actinobacteria bacterium]|nr:hypothetical protein [Actinomycetota bacterium]